VLGHVRPHACGDVVVDGAHHIDLDPAATHDPAAQLDQPVGVAGLRRTLQRAVDEEGSQALEARAAVLRQQVVVLVLG
jgi:hypothetical protein